MINQLAADWFILTRSAVLRVTVAVSAVCAVVFLALARGFATGALDVSQTQSASGVSDVFIILLLGGLLVGVTVARDFETRTIHDSLLATTRGRYVAARTISHVACICLLGAPYAVAAIVAFASGMEFAPFLPTTPLQIAGNMAGVEVGAASIMLAIGVGISMLLLYAAQLAVCLPLAFVLRKPVAVMAIGFVFNLVASMALDPLQDVAGIGHLVALTPYTSDALLGLDASWAEVGTSIVRSVAFIVAMALASHLWFRRADIK